MTTSTLSQNGQTTIPAKVREFLHIDPVDKLLYRFEGNRVIIEPAASSTQALYGSFHTNRKPPAKRDLQAARKAWYARKLGQ
ncbi:MAG: AbrB/MazE/SpoVT family DNA-binding domain-containing protein [Opitutaceae bacterium]|jgi:AbrB family looped-hinge helix DNA binding protein|nr:AbrB/MazE/SpoVT family DNA-binding domain-containing protein [Opitutaceae bacterium]